MLAAFFVLNIIPIRNACNITNIEMIVIKDTQYHTLKKMAIFVTIYVIITCLYALAIHTSGRRF
ncbi:hypothetical protein SPTER_44480 [Sporomusa termitida]|uniref:Uncharacterized protein n=2 Tax=Sporomusa termitida TaxID=2377 RepID=A0A517E058_9FIRM|nr:hypothetical protein SPTER_44480 [Sporomusa termitida]